MSRCVVTVNEDRSPESPLRRARVNAAISQRQAAAHIGIDPRLLNDAEHGRAALGFAKIDALYGYYHEAMASQLKRRT